MVVRLPFFLKSNSTISQMECCLCSKYVIIYSPDLWNLLIRINSWKGSWELKLNWSLCHCYFTSRNDWANKSKIVQRRCIIFRPGLYNLQNRLKTKKISNSWNWSFQKLHYWMVWTIDDTQTCGHVQNLLDNLKTQLIQYTDQHKVARQVASSRN